MDVVEGNRARIAVGGGVLQAIPGEEHKERGQTAAIACAARR
jgi:hypothetical protein